jgi:glycine hydroxymethyltransferase
VTGGTDNHLVLVDVLNSIGVTGVEAEKALDEVNITVNKNAIPFDTTKPTVDSGIRLGSAAMTTKGYSADDFRTIGHWIGTVLKNKDDAGVKAKVKEQVLAMTAAHPFE